MRLIQDGRPLKRWRYVGVFCEELMACAALVQVGPVRQSFWAILTRADGRLREHTRLFPRDGRLELPAGTLAGYRNGGHARARVRARASIDREYPPHVSIASIHLPSGVPPPGAGRSRRCAR